MDIQTLMYFDEPKGGEVLLHEPYCVAISEAGQVFYCEADENHDPNGHWRLVRMDPEEMSRVH